MDLVRSNIMHLNIVHWCVDFCRFHSPKNGLFLRFECVCRDQPTHRTAIELLGVLNLLKIIKLCFNVHKIKNANYKKYPNFRPINRCSYPIYRWLGDVRKVFLSPLNLCVKRTIKSEVKYAQNLVCFCIPLLL